MSWKQCYFDWLSTHCDPETGIGLEGCHGKSELYALLNGWFHYLFNYSYARVPFPYAERLIDSCIEMYRNHELSDSCSCISFRY